MRYTLAYIALLLQFFALGAVHAQNVITVAHTGGDFTSPVDALDAIGTTLPASAPGNRYLVVVEPGVYVVSRSVNMKPFVDLQGSGVKTTVIRGAIPFDNGGPVFGSEGVINAASRSEIRQLTVRNTVESISGIGIAVIGTRGSLISDVRSVARGGADDSGNWKYGIRIVNSRNTRLDNVVARGTTTDFTLCQGAAIRNSSVTIRDSRLVGAVCSIGLGIVVDDGSRVELQGSLVRGEGSINGIGISAGSSDTGVHSSVRVRHSRILGAVIAGLPGDLGITDVHISHSEMTGPVTGSPICFSVHDLTLSPLTSACVP
jgi:hypothetical protein